MQAFKVKNEMPLLPSAGFESKNYPALPPQDDFQLDGIFDVLVNSVRVHEDRRGELFPWTRCQGWYAGMKRDWVVPCHEEPSTGGNTILVVTGLSGKPLIPSTLTHSRLAAPSVCGGFLQAA